MTTPYFSERDRRPTDRTIALALGRTAAAWQALFAKIRAEHPQLGHTWKYYADGKSWLLKLSDGATTVCWLVVEQGAFSVAFYFAERRKGDLLASDLSPERKAEIRSQPASGKLRRVSVRFGPKRNLKDVMTLIVLRKKLR
jgi:hypothetical protein